MCRHTAEESRPVISAVLLTPFFLISSLRFIVFSFRFHFCPTSCHVSTTKDARPHAWAGLFFCPLGCLVAIFLLKPKLLCGNLRVNRSPSAATVSDGASGAHQQSEPAPSGPKWALDWESGGEASHEPQKRGDAHDEFTERDVEKHHEQEGHDGGSRAKETGPGAPLLPPLRRRDHAAAVDQRRHSTVRCSAAGARRH